MQSDSSRPDTTLQRLDSNARDRVSGPAWDGIRPTFFALAERLLNVAPSVVSELTTIYVKFRTVEGEGGEVFAVVWIKKSTEFVVGLCLPDGFPGEGLSGPPKSSFKYGALNRYFVVPVDGALPEAVDQWARAAFEQVSGLKGEYGTQS